MVNKELTMVKEYIGFFGKLRYVFSGILLILSICILTVPFIFSEKEISVFISFAIILFPVSLLLLLISLYSLNQFPSILLIKEGISISYNFRRLFIPWEKIRSIKGDRRLPLGRVYIFSDSLPSLYYMYGLERAKLSRAFIIDPTLSIKDLNELVEFVALNSKIKIEIFY